MSVRHENVKWVDVSLYLLLLNLLLSTDLRASSHAIQPPLIQFYRAFEALLPFS
jgi:hypothetical protein